MVGMSVDLFAGVAVREIGVASGWYERFFGGEPAFLPNEVEAVWEVGEHQYVYIAESVERAGNALVTLFVGDLDAVVDGISARGIEPVKRETYENGVRKVVYNDPDGNEIGYGGGPAEDAGSAENA
jgi:catechol 2,3-dioxygenase-like lactoylglutathione lyase family enzyme